MSHTQDEASELARELRVREDQDSVQLSSPASKRFWLRLLTRPGDITFSDFLLDPADGPRAVAALLYLNRTRQLFRPGATVVMTDILPRGVEGELDKQELVRRHDQIIDVFTEFSALRGLGVPDAHLDTRAGRFDTIVRLRDRESAASDVSG